MVKVTGTGAIPSETTLNYYDYSSAYDSQYDYGDSGADSQGVLLGEGSYTFVCGLDLNGNGTLDATEGLQTAKVYVVNADINGDYNRDGSPVDHTNEAAEVLFEKPEGFVILANCDDDDGDGEPDTDDSIINTNDLDDIFVLNIDRFGLEPDVLSTNLTVEFAVFNASGSQSSDLRIFPNRAVAESGYVSFSVSSESSMTNYFSGSGITEMGIEGKAYGEQLLVRMQVKHDGALLDEDSVNLLVAPFMALSNIEETETVYSGAGSSADPVGWPTLYGELTNELHGIVEVVDFMDKIFLQDRAEIGCSKLPDGMSGDPKSVILGLDTDLSTLVSTNMAYCYYGGGDGGSIEASPRTDEYPYGRVILGNELGSVTNYFKNQLIQTHNGDIITLTVDWLAVGHVDEVFTIVPSGGGFKVLVADLQLAIDLLEDNPSESTSGGFDSRADIVGYYNNTNNTDRIALITNSLATIREQLADGLGLSESDFIKVPVAFDMGGLPSNPEAGTYLPNMINMLVIKNDSGTRRLLIPDPYFGPFESSLSTNLAAIGYTAAERRYIDTREAHTYSGEVHCTTIPKRIVD